MELNEKTIEELEARKSEIATECEKEGADLNALEEEVKAINEEIESRRKAELEKEELRKKAFEQGKKIPNPINDKENKKMFEVNSKEYRNAWLKTLQGVELTEEERAGYTQTSTYATNAIPTIVADRFFLKLKKTAPLINEITLFQVAGNLKFFVQGTDGAVSAHTENQAMTAATDTTVGVQLGAIEFAKVVGISKSAKMMSVDAFEDYIVEYLGEDIARAIDNYILNGSSNGVDVAITWTSGTNEIVATQDYTYGDFCKLVALLPAGYDDNAKFLINKKTLWEKVAYITNSAGNPIFVQNTEEGMVGRILGYPVLVDDYVSTTKSPVFLGDFRRVVGNLSEGISVESDASAGFASASILYRGYASFDSKPAVEEAFVKMIISA